MIALNVLRDLESNDPMVDLIRAMQEPPADIDLHKANQLAFVDPKKSINQEVALVLYDETSYHEAFTADEVLTLVSRKKIEGIIIPASKIRDMVIMLLDAYPSLVNQNARMEDRLKVANRISAFLTDMRVM